MKKKESKNQSKKDGKSKDDKKDDDDIKNEIHSAKLKLVDFMTDLTKEVRPKYLSGSKMK